MHNASKLGFATRRPGDGPVITQGLSPGQTLRPEPAGAKNAVLKTDCERVLVRAVHHQTEGTYTGEIYGFEPSYSLEFGGMKVGERIEFRDEHVFSCDI